MKNRFPIIRTRLEWLLSTFTDAPQKREWADMYGLVSGLNRFIQRF